MQGHAGGHPAAEAARGAGAHRRADGALPGGEAEPLLGAEALAAHAALWLRASPLEQLQRLREAAAPRGAEHRASGRGPLGRARSPERAPPPRARFPPTLILHGSHDSIIPLESSELLLRVLSGLDEGPGAGCAAAGALRDAAGRCGAAAPASQAVPGGEGSHGGRAGLQPSAHGGAPQSSSRGLRRHTLVPVAGARHSFSWLLSAPTLATHDLVADWIAHRS